MNLKIIEAIKTKSVLKISYKTKEVRFVEPFCYGSTFTGKEFLRGWQLSGFSNHSIDIPNWRLFNVDEISTIEVTKDNFVGSRPSYNPNDSAMAQIYCHI
jgi:hypothetical protein